MKTRLISATVGILVLLFVLAFFDTIIVNIAIGLVALLAVYEMLHATKNDDNKVLLAISLLIAFCIPFYPIQKLKSFLPIIVYVFIIALFATFIKYHKTMKFEQVTVSIFTSVLIPIALTVMVFFRDKNSTYIGLYYVIISLGASWLTDTGAYFIGVNFGKHKMCPEISPKKTIEGAIGGIATCIISMVLLTFAFEKAAPFFQNTVTANYIVVLISAPILSLLSMIGDLSASAIKRQYGVKDFGNIMPGHGGALDRFDSVLMVVPAVYIIAKMFPFMV